MQFIPCRYVFMLTIKMLIVFNNAHKLKGLHSFPRVLRFRTFRNERDSSDVPLTHWSMKPKDRDF